MHSASVNIKFESSEIANYVFSAINPDNAPLPSDLEITCAVEGNTMFIHIKTGRSIQSLQNTIEDIMSAIDLSLRTMISIG